MKLFGKRGRSRQDHLAYVLAGEADNEVGLFDHGGIDLACDMRAQVDAEPVALFDEEVGRGHLDLQGAGARDGDPSRSQLTELAAQEQRGRRRAAQIPRADEQNPRHHQPLHTPHAGPEAAGRSSCVEQG